MNKENDKSSIQRRLVCRPEIHEGKEGMKLMSFIPSFPSINSTGD